MIKKLKRFILHCPFLLILFLGWPIAAIATPISIDFNDLTEGTNVTDQYNQSGVTFASSLSDPSSPGYVDPSQSLKANSKDGGIYLLFESPIYSFNVSVFEYPQNDDYYDDGGEEEYYDEEYSVHLVVFDDNLSSFGPEIIVSSTNIWSPMAITEKAGMGAIWLYGTKDFRIDDIMIEDTVPVPEPSTMLLFGSGLFGLALYGRKRKKT